MAIAAIAASLVGLGVQGSDELTPETLFEETHAAARDANTFHYTITERFSGPQSPTAGLFDFSVSGSSIEQQQRSVATMKLHVLNVSITCGIVASRDDVFVNVPPERRSELQATWMRTSLASLNDAGGLKLSPDQVFTDQDMLFRKLQIQGTAVIRGVETTRFRGLFDVADIASAFDDPTVLKSVKAKIPFAVYVDDDHLIRRLGIEISSTLGFTMKLTVDLFDYGDHIAISVPADGVRTAPSGEDAISACFPAGAGI